MEKFKLENQEPAIESNKENKEIKSIYRGIWAEKLKDGQELSMGGSLFNEKLSKKIELDFSSFEEDINGFTEEKIKESYEKNKDKVIGWLNRVGSDIDPYTYYHCYQIQQKTEKLLEINLEDSIEKREGKREEVYNEKKIPKLSELKGKPMCTEIAALGQYLLQKININSIYVGGITMIDGKSKDEFPEDHSFIVLKDPNKKEVTLIFDIARPRIAESSRMPRILETEIPFNYELLKDEENLIVGATEVLQRKRKLWFGVGDPVAGNHRLAIEDNN
jgi:hypothetical protein